TLYWTRKPSNTFIVPSSILTGTETSNCRLGTLRTARMLSSSRSKSAAILNCSLAISEGFKFSCGLTLVIDFPPSRGREISSRLKLLSHAHPKGRHGGRPPFVFYAARMQNLTIGLPQQDRCNGLSVQARTWAGVASGSTLRPS